MYLPCPCKQICIGTCKPIPRNEFKTHQIFVHHSLLVLFFALCHCSCPYFREIIIRYTGIKYEIHKNILPRTNAYKF